LVTNAGSTIGINRIPFDLSSSIYTGKSLNRILS
jgi:hypothetical protein